MSGTLGGIGSALQGATALAGYVLGNNTSTTSNTNGVTGNQQSVTTNVTDQQVSSASPIALDMLQKIAQLAINNSQDPTKTQGLIQGILQQAGDAMTTIFGKAAQSGVYNSSATNTQTNDVLSRATADAATAVLGYQTSQEQIAANAANNLASATAIKTDTASTAVHSESATQTASTTQSKSKSGMSVVCTWMHNNNMLSTKRYYLVTKDFLAKPWYHQAGYHIVAHYFLKALNKNSKSFLSKFLISLFYARTEYVCALHNLQGAKKTWKGKLALGFVWSICALPAIYVYLKSKFNFNSGMKTI